jgi:hypothetical protein
MIPSCGDCLPGIVTDRLVRSDVHYPSLIDSFGLCVGCTTAHEPAPVQFSVKLHERVQHERETETHESKENPHSADVSESNRSIDGQLRLVELMSTPCRAGLRLTMSLIMAAAG